MNKEKDPKNSKRLVEIALSKKKPDKTPIWLMRQAGRYLPEYRKISAIEKNFLSMCYNSDIATEITLQPIKRFKELDAAIVFSDILVIADALGCKLEFIKDFGPVINFEAPQDLINPEEIQSKIEPILKTIKNVRRELSNDKTLIGFAGSPWTVLSYILEGKGSKDYAKALKICYSNRSYATSLLKKITDATVIFLIKQIEAGIDVIQLFDSNAGILTESMFNTFVIEPTRSIVNSIRAYRSDIKIIGFPRKAGEMYRHYADKTNVDAVSVDQYINLNWAKKNIQSVIQGNLDPYILAYRKEKIENEVIELKIRLRDNPFIFNLGHGVIKDTPIENVERLIECVKHDF